MAREEIRSKKPFKIWDNWRNIRKGLVVSNLEELILKGKEKLGVPVSENISLVLESDGTQIEDGEYFKTLPSNTILLLLRHGERWCPTGVDIIRAAISAIPKIVCETIHALELHNETPSWKIMDNKGRVTVVLHWDQRSPSSLQIHQQKFHENYQNKLSPSKKIEINSAQLPSLIIQSNIDKLNCNKSPTHSDLIKSGHRYNSPQITVINHDDIVQPSFTCPSNSSYKFTNQREGFTRQGTNSFDSTTIHIHTAECSNHIHQSLSRNGSPINHFDSGPSLECDFHCCALHEEGRRIAVHKSVATSPIQDSQLHTHYRWLQTPSPQQSSSITDSNRRNAFKGHVRFRDTTCEEEKRLPSLYTSNIQGQHLDQRDSSESETENTFMDDEIVTSEKFLLLIDQLTVDQKRHLSIKDIGIILERLNSKILDVEKLDRESESDECYNWTIKAIIKGDMLRELGVIYNGNYYAISEHPGYKEDSEENNYDNDDREEDDKL